MDFANFWYSAGAAANSGDFGDPIGNSLRFRGTDVVGDGNPYMIKNPNFAGNSSSNSTLSWWAKHNADYTWRTMWQSSQFHIYMSNGSDWIDAFYGTYQLGTSTNDRRRFRDPNAWYHYVVKMNGDNPTEIYVNGLLQTITNSTNSRPMFNNGSCHYGGYWNALSGSTWSPDGNLAKVYHIDGQALDPTEFGRFNEDGIWVPKSYTVPQRSGASYDLRSYSGTAAPLSWDSMQNRFADRPMPANFGLNTGHSSIALRAPGATGINLSAPFGTSGLVMNYWLSDDGVNWDGPYIFDYNVLNADRGGFTTHTEYVVWQFRDGEQFTNPSWMVREGNTNSFQLDFDDDSDWGKDSSGNNNGWNFSPAFIPEDYSKDSPTNNYCMFNSANYSNNTMEIKKGGYQATGSSDWNAICGQALGKDKYYVELTVDSLDNGYPCLFVIDIDEEMRNGSYLHPNSIGIRPFSSGGLIYFEDGTDYTSSFLTTDTVQPGDVLQLFFDGTTNSVWYGRNNTYYGLSGTTTREITEAQLLNGDFPFKTFPTDRQCIPVVTPFRGPAYATINFGSQPFTHLPPAGYVSLNTDNQRVPRINKPQEHFKVFIGPGQNNTGAGFTNGSWSPYLYTALMTDNGYGGLGKNFNTSQPASNAFNGATGDRANNAAEPATDGTYLVFQPPEPITVSTSLRVFTRNYQGGAKYVINDGNVLDMPTIGGNGANDWAWADLNFTGTLNSVAVRDQHQSRTLLFGIEIDGQVLVEDGILEQAKAEFPEGIYWIKSQRNENHQWVDSLRGTGTASTNPQKSTQAYFQPSGQAVCWAWKLTEDFTPVSAGGLNSLAGKRNPDAGVSVVTATGTNTNPSYVTHGLQNKPAFIICKAQSNTSDFAIYHKFQGDTTNNVMFLGSSSGNSNRGALTFEVDDEKVTLGSFGEIASSAPYVYYFFEEVEGLSKFGTYQGTSSGDNGRFVYCGFKPALVFVKSTGSSDNWTMWSTPMSPAKNPLMDILYPNLTNAQYRGDSNKVDFLSNGFRIMGSDGNSGASREYLYCAWAEHPFGNPKVAPSTAR